MTSPTQENQTSPQPAPDPAPETWARWWLPIGVAFAAIALAEWLPGLRGLRPYVAPLVLLYTPFFFDRSLSLQGVGLVTPTRRGVGLAIGSSLLFFVPFYLVTRYVLWGEWPGPPQPWWDRLFAELLFAGLPEEVFFRGWLLPRAERLLRGKAWTLFGLRLTAGNLVTSVAFAVMHLSTGRLDRLNVFFPSLWFGWLTQVSRSIWPAIVVHAISNVWMAAASGY